MTTKIKQRKPSSIGGKPKRDLNNANSTEQVIHQESSEKSKTSSVIGKIDYKRIALRCCLIIGLILFMNYNQKDSFETFASQSEEIEKRTATVKCDSEYIKDIKEFPDCIPNNCGRMISDYVVSLAEVQALLIIAQKGLSLGGSVGGASILDLHSGALSQGGGFVDIYKVDKLHKAITAEDLKFYNHIKNKIKTAIAGNFGLKQDSLYLTHPTFFSRMTSASAQTVHDEYWHPHVDKETYKSFHYTSLLYLTDYGHHFQGGRFVFVDGASNKTVEPREGRLSAFTSGAENLHYVEKVTGGTRYAITVSFTCDPQYAIADPSLSRKS